MKTKAELRKIAAGEKNLLAKATKIQGFTLSIWHDAEGKPFVNYVCEKCQYASLYGVKAQEHIKEGVHAWKRPIKRTRKVRTDKGAVY